jgi:hypothetical protein
LEICTNLSRRRLLLAAGGVIATCFDNSVHARETSGASTGANPIQLENQKLGTDEWQLTNPASRREIEGYASQTSINRGEHIDLFVNTRSSEYSIEVFRMGWYAGSGGRRMTPPEILKGRKQVIPSPVSDSGLIDCEWRDPYTLRISDSSDAPEWTSGIYLVKLTTQDSGKQSYIMFVIRDDMRSSNYLMQSSVTTFQAYNNWGGKSLYGSNSRNKVAATKVSFNRPYAVSPKRLAQYGMGAGEFLTNFQRKNRKVSGAAWECNMVRFLEREGYDVTYCTSVDTHAEPQLLLSHRGCLFVGHDEYWSWEQRSNVETARDSGVNLGFFAANVCYWQIRFESSSIGAPNRTMVAYKEHDKDPFALDSDKLNDRLITEKWRDNPIKPPEDALIGVMYVTNPIDGDIVIEDPSVWVCAGTGLRKGDRLTGLLGYEVDRMSSRAPLGTKRIAHSPFNKGKFAGHSDMTVYTAPSRATVFAVGTMQWNWGLDDYNAPRLRASVLNPQAQQITRNVLAKFVS